MINTEFWTIVNPGLGVKWKEMQRTRVQGGFQCIYNVLFLKGVLETQSVLYYFLACCMTETFYQNKMVKTDLAWDLYIGFSLFYLWYEDFNKRHFMLDKRFSAQPGNELYKATVRKPGSCRKDFSRFA